MAHDDEEHLAGNVGGAVRIGATVRRPTGPWTPAWAGRGPSMPPSPNFPIPGPGDTSPWRARR